ncbi:hypothetical protein CDAR_557701 [Caerostris darwini]|uniref:Uncharacterized protein n=1 Tax=Caerostris darwini TaxID=1538125 RepID=A0AAV4W1J6_9ARAC|nr:hypothetical protein CDAR_557701 [Caerostris darwini]
MVTQQKQHKNLFLHHPLVSYLPLPSNSHKRTDDKIHFQASPQTNTKSRGTLLPSKRFPPGKSFQPPEAKRKPRAHETAFYTDRDRTAYAIIAFIFSFTCIIYGCRTASLYPAAVARGSYTKEGVLI